MKRLLPALGVFAALFVACSPKYIKDCSAVPGFDFKRSYKIAVLTPYVSGGSEAFAQRMQDHAIGRVSEARKLLPVNKFQIREIENAMGMGMSYQPSPSTAIEIARQLGADLAMITEIGLQPVAGDKIAPLYCSVSIVDVATGSQVYSGSGRTANPVSKEAAGEWLIDLATDCLIKGFK